MVGIGGFMGCKWATHAPSSCLKERLLGWSAVVGYSSQSWWLDVVKERIPGQWYGVL